MKNIVDETCKVLENGGTILYPTDTIWGLGCDACNENAITRIYDIKHRDKGKSMLILVDSMEMMKNFTTSIPEIAVDLIEAADRPLTIIYPEAKNLPKNLVAEDGSIGIRIVNDDFCREVIGLLGRPIVSTSANLSGCNPPLGFCDIANEIKSEVDYIVPLRQDELSRNRNSDIVKVDESGNIQVIR